MSGLVLDTHVLLWWEQRSSALPPTARKLIEEFEGDVFVSAASVFEIAIKRRLGKLIFEGSPSLALRASDFRELPVTADDAEAAGELAWEHRDPFDRLIVAQCLRRRLALLTFDRAIRTRVDVKFV